MHCIFDLCVGSRCCVCQVLLKRDNSQIPRNNGLAATHSIMYKTDIMLLSSSDIDFC